MLSWLRKRSALVNGWCEMIEMWHRHGVRDYLITLLHSIEPQDLLVMLAQAGISYETGWTLPAVLWRAANVSAPRVGVQWAFVDLLAEELMKAGPATMQRFQDVIEANYTVIQGQLERRNG